MKYLLIFLLVLAIFVISVTLGAQNDQQVTFNYLLAQGEYRISTLLAAGIVLGFDFWFFVSGQMSLNGAVRTAMTAVSGGLLLIYLFIITYVFPLQARFYNPVKRTLFNAFFMSVRHLFQTIGILATDLGIAAATYFGLFYFPQFAMLLFLFGMPLIAFVNSYFFTAIFRKYMPKEEEQEHTDATPLLGEEDEEMKEAIRNLKGK